GEIGQGAKIAFNVLNYGRLKLCAMCTGSARPALAEAAAYARTRTQFGQPIAAFGAIQHKLAEMAVRLYAVESMLYRTTGDIDRILVPTLLIKRSLKQHLGVLDAARKAFAELAPGSTAPARSHRLTESTSAASRAGDAITRAALVVLGAAVSRFGERLDTEQ